MDFNMKAELVSTIVIVLIAYNVLGSMLTKLLERIKDSTKTQADNIAYSVFKKGCEKVKESLDYLLGNTKH